MNGNTDSISNEALLLLDARSQAETIRAMTPGRISEINDELLVQLQDGDTFDEIIARNGEITSAQFVAISKLQSERVNGWSDDFLLRLGSGGQCMAIDKLPVERINRFSNEFLLQLKGGGQNSAINKLTVERVNNMNDDLLLQLKQLGQAAALHRMSIRRLNRINDRILAGLTDLDRMHLNQRVEEHNSRRISDLRTHHSNQMPPMEADGCCCQIM